MKVFDASNLIGILKDIGCPELFDHILKLGHELAVPSHVFENELKDELALAGVTKLVDEGKIKILPKNSIEDLLLFSEENHKIDFGETDVLLSYEKLKKSHSSVYCILDDEKARSVAFGKNITFTGLLGLLKLLRERKIIAPDEYTRYIRLLKKSSFRIPRDYPES